MGPDGGWKDKVLDAPSCPLSVSDVEFRKNRKYGIRVSFLQSEMKVGFLTLNRAKTEVISIWKKIKATDLKLFFSG